MGYPTSSRTTVGASLDVRTSEWIYDRVFRIRDWEKVEERSRLQDYLSEEGDCKGMKLGENSTTGA